MSDDLVRLLRRPYGNLTFAEKRDAADRIEELEAERHVFVAAVSEAARARGEAEGRLEASEAAGVLEGWIEKCAALEAKLAKAVEALRKSAHEQRNIAGMGLIGASSIAYNAAREAEATLAELAGESHEQ